MEVPRQLHAASGRPSPIYGSPYPTAQRAWASQLAQRLLEDGERVLDVPARLAARVRLFDTGHNRKPDARAAHSVAVVAVRATTLRVLQVDGELEALRMLCDRRRALARRRVQTVDRLQALLAELLPGQAKRDITTGQANAMLASVRPRDIDGKMRRRIATEELAELIAVEAKIKKAITARQHVGGQVEGDRARPRLTAHGNPASGPWSRPGFWPTSATSPGSPIPPVRVLGRRRTARRILG